MAGRHPAGTRDRPAARPGRASHPSHEPTGNDCHEKSRRGSECFGERVSPIWLIGRRRQRPLSSDRPRPTNRAGSDCESKRRRDLGYMTTFSRQCLCSPTAGTSAGRVRMALLETAAVAAGQHKTGEPNMAIQRRVRRSTPLQFVDLEDRNVRRRREPWAGRRSCS